MPQVLFTIYLMLLSASSEAISTLEPARVGPPPSNGDQSALVCEADASAATGIASLEPRDLILNIGGRFNVPPEIIYAIWQKETLGLRSGWGNGRGWFQAYRLSYKNGRCVKKYGAAACWKNWLRLKAICGQRRADGTRVCDPMKVRTAYGLEMGPMQFVPDTLLRQGGRSGMDWTEYAVDFDGDGVVDPLSLPDAMASAAKYLRIQFDLTVAELGEQKAWRYAIIQYNGSAEYYYGKPADPGVRQYMRDWWCLTPGVCVCQDQP